jgi:alkanesulfonate monooxygenase
VDEIAKLTGANSNTTALVGTPEQVAEVSATTTISASAISSFAASIR